MVAFPKALRLRRRGDFRRLGSNGQRRYGRSIALEVAPSPVAETRLGITVSRKYGKATVRNRFKRRVRETFRLCYPLLLPALDINVRPLKSAGHISCREIMADLLSLVGSEAKPPSESSALL